MFCGTSNDKNFLKDRTGNRRYLPIDCEATPETKKRIFNYDEARPYFRQVIAEAVAEYKKNPSAPLVLPYELEEEAKQAQLRHLEEDVWVSIIEDFLEAEPVHRVNAAYIWEKAFDKNPADMRKGEASRIVTIMRNDIEGWSEIGKARLPGYGRGAVCFERDTDAKGDKIDTIGDTFEGGAGFETVDDTLDIPF